MPDQAPERRRVRRIRASLNIVVHHEDSTCNGQTLDISELGASCAIELPVPIFDSINVAISSPPNIDSASAVYDVFKTDAIVVSCRKQPNQDSYRLGFYYDGLPNSERRRIKKWLKVIFSMNRRGLIP